MSKIKISVLTPVYNGENFISKCIEAVNNCNYDHDLIEHIIVDDGSTDKTKNICLEYAKKYKHIKFYSKSNGNWGSVINFVIENKLVSGDYVIICDSDDIILPNAFKLVNERNNNSDMVVGDFYHYDGKKRGARFFTNLCLFKHNFSKKYSQDCYFYWFPPHCSYLKKEIFYQTPKLMDKFYYQDGVLYNVAQQNSKTITHINKGISLYWSKREGNSNSKPESQLSIDSRLHLLSYFEKNNMLMPFLTTVGSYPSFLKKLCKKNKHFFTNTKLNLNAFPFYMRPFMFIWFKILIKIYITKKINKTSSIIF